MSKYDFDDDFDDFDDDFDEDFDFDDLSSDLDNSEELSDINSSDDGNNSFEDSDDLDINVDYEGNSNLTDADDLAIDSDNEKSNFNDSDDLKDLDYDINALHVHISSSLTSKKIIQLMDDYPSLKKITCPKSLYDRISPKYLKILEELGVAVEIKYNWGKSKYSEEDIKQVVDLLKNGKSPKVVADLLNMPLNKVYYLKKISPDYVKLDYRKRKYDDETRRRIRDLNEEGKKAKEIAKMESIPLRTIYYILNNK